ncbi:MAG: adenylate/guanylate cyclase domain-containing protein, partial [bacterium]
MKRKVNLVPQFICSRRNEQKGRFFGTVMFADISGFTSMTESLMKEGKYGAEILSDGLNALFEKITGRIYARGGFISSFAGDAFTAVFRDNPDEALLSAVSINQLFEDEGIISDGDYHFDLDIKIGLSYGNVSWGILGERKRYTYFFRGRAIENSVSCQDQCSPGDIIIDKDLKAVLKQNDFHFKERGEFFTLHMPDNESGSNSDIALNYCSNQEDFGKFNPVIMESDNEFRDTVNIFINFRGIRSFSELDVFTDNIRNIADRTGGYFNSLEFGDKGSKMLIVFGAPVSFVNNTERALMFIDEVFKTYSGKVRAGMTKGTVYAGFMGSRRATYTVLGDTVNLAARLMTASKWGHVLCSNEVMKSAAAFRKFDFTGAISVKGKSSRIETYSPGSVVYQSHGKDIVGRDKETEQLEHYLEPLNDNKFPGIIIVTGQTGSGKTDFVKSFVNNNAQRFES